MAQQLNAYINLVRAAAGYPPYNVLSKDTIIQAINNSYWETAYAWRHNALKRNDTITTANGRARYALPVDYWWMRVVRDETNDQRLVRKRLEWMENEYDRASGTTDTGQPLYWCVEGDHVELAPVPDGTYTIRLWYQRRPARLVAALDTDDLDNEWEEVLLLGAIQRVFFILGEYERHVHTLNLQRRLENKLVEPEDLDAQTGVDTTGPLEDEFSVPG